MKYIFYVLVAIFAVFTLSFSSSPLVIPKIALLVLFIGLALVIWLIQINAKGKFSFSLGKFDLAVFLFMVSYLVSALIKTPNKMEAFFFPGTATLFIAGALLYFLLNQFKKGEKNGFVASLIISAVLLSLSLLFTQIELFSKIPQIPSYIKDANFNPAGGAVPSLIYLICILPLSLGALINEKDLIKKLFFAVSSAIILAGLSVNITNILPGKLQSPRFLPLSTSWEISAQAIRVSPIIGIGPGNYLTAFNIYRPISYNQTDLWALKFFSANNFYLTVLTEAGILGILSIAIMLISFFLLLKKFKFSLEAVSLLVLFILLAVFPTSPVITVLLFILLSLNSRSEEKKFEILKGSPRFLIMILSVPFFAGIFAFGYIAKNTLAAEEKYRQSLESLARNDVKAAYDNLRGAIDINPRVDRYHATLVQLNLAAASSIASKKEVTDTDRETITRLIQSSVAEGKATVSLNPVRSGNWEVLAGVYRTVMPFTQGADNYAIQSYTQAVNLDPTNVILRISLGGTYFALGRLDEAIEAFKLAVIAKPDHANSHYNLAIAYREKKDFKKATEEINTVLSLIGKDSADYETALNELRNLENLNSPQPVEESSITPPISLPQDAVPPQSQ